MSHSGQEKYEDSVLYRIRHSAAHVMAQAVVEMFPEAKYTIGPPVENGFYYDFDLPRSIFKDQPYKLELIDGLEQGSLDEYGMPLKEKPELSVFQHDTFVDLCR